MSYPTPHVRSTTVGKNSMKGRFFCISSNLKILKIAKQTTKTNKKMWKNTSKVSNILNGSFFFFSISSNLGNLQEMVGLNLSTARHFISLSGPHWDICRRPCWSIKFIWRKQLVQLWQQKRTALTQNNRFGEVLLSCYACWIWIDSPQHISLARAQQQGIKETVSSVRCWMWEQNATHNVPDLKTPKLWFWYH